MKLPLGMLSSDKIKRSNLILSEIAKYLIKVPETAAQKKTRDEKVMDLTEAFYQTIPYDFGMKKPASIDQLIRVK